MDIECERRRGEECIYQQQQGGASKATRELEETNTFISCHTD
jgi:hypothetical protein